MRSFGKIKAIVLVIAFFTQQSAAKNEYKSVMKKMNKVKKQTFDDIKASLAIINSHEGYYSLNEETAETLLEIKSSLKEVKENFAKTHKEVFDLLDILRGFIKMVADLEQQRADAMKAFHCREDQPELLFSGALNSNIIYQNDIRHHRDYQQKYDFTMEFSTTAENGVILFTSDDINIRDDFIAIYIENGFVKHSFNNFNATITLVSNIKYNDGLFHSARFVKTFNESELYVDDESHFGNTDESSIGTNSNRRVFVGGLENATQASYVEQYLGAGMGVGFQGCIKNFKIFGDCLGPAEEINNVGTCSP